MCPEKACFVWFVNPLTRSIQMKHHRSNHWRCSIKKGIVKNFIKFTGKHPCQISFLLKKDTLAQLFSCELCEFLRLLSLQNTSGRLLLSYVKSGLCYQIYIYIYIYIYIGLYLCCYWQWVFLVALWFDSHWIKYLHLWKQSLEIKKIEG